MFGRSLSFLFLIICCVINLLCVLSLSSCWVNNERVFEHAIEYDGVLVEDPTVHYMHEGKPYRRGVRVNWQWTRDSSWSSFGENIIGPSHWKRTAVPGSESAVYCRELVKGVGYEKMYNTYYTTKRGSFQEKRRFLLFSFELFMGLEKSRDIPGGKTFLRKKGSGFYVSFSKAGAQYIAASVAVMVVDHIDNSPGVLNCIGVADLIPQVKA